MPQDYFKSRAQIQHALYIGRFAVFKLAHRLPGRGVPEKTTRLTFTVWRCSKISIAGEISHGLDAVRVCFRHPHHSATRENESKDTGKLLALEAVKEFAIQPENGNTSALHRWIVSRNGLEKRLY